MEDEVRLQLPERRQGLAVAGGVAVADERVAGDLLDRHRPAGEPLGRGRDEQGERVVQDAARDERAVDHRVDAGAERDVELLLHHHVEQLVRVVGLVEDDLDAGTLRGEAGEQPGEHPGADALDRADAEAATITARDGLDVGRCATEGAPARLGRG